MGSPYPPPNHIPPTPYTLHPSADEITQVASTMVTYTIPNSLKKEMANCPVCNNEYTESKVENCSKCGWDLTPYPLTFPGQIPEDFLAKERKKLAWAKQVWLKSQLKVELERANLEIASLQSQLELAQQVKLDLDRANKEISSLQSQLELTVTREQLNKQNLEELKILNQTLKAEIQSLKLQLESLDKKHENQGDAHFEGTDYEKAIPFYELAINLGSTTAKGKLKQAKIKAEEIKHLDLGNGVILELVKIPAGSFKMGGDHEINLKSFLLGKYKVTQKQYQLVMGNNPSYFKGDNLPVEQVSWYDAVEFCQKLKAKTGRQVMLPSEAQWEYAARAGTEGDYFFGDNYDQLGEYAWYDENSGGQTHPVGEKKPNPWGLYDILGNVWERCQDGWVDDYHQLPRSGSALQNNNTTYNWRRANWRGGSWHLSGFYCQCGYRNRNSGDLRCGLIGFRVLVALARE